MEALAADGSWRGAAVRNGAASNGTMKQRCPHPPYPSQRPPTPQQTRRCQCLTRAYCAHTNAHWKPARPTHHLWNWARHNSIPSHRQTKRPFLNAMHGWVAVRPLTRPILCAYAVVRRPSQAHAIALQTEAGRLLRPEWVLPCGEAPRADLFVVPSTNAGSCYYLH
ncbi:hypothetical protein T492DRAFT_102328 [Pavlovales sp. CCMP2436]|nr:hypothetical protein T492DRAFT_102328 [Pavlovales sp. CCMP2436]